jgi:hypothetical protein
VVHIVLHLSNNYAGKPPVKKSKFKEKRDKLKEQVRKANNVVTIE